MIETTLESPSDTTFRVLHARAYRVHATNAAEDVRDIARRRRHTYDASFHATSLLRRAPQTCAPRVWIPSVPDVFEPNLDGTLQLAVLVCASRREIKNKYVLEKKTKQITHVKRVTFRYLLVRATHRLPANRQTYRSTRLEKRSKGTISIAFSTYHSTP